MRPSFLAYRVNWAHLFPFLLLGGCVFEHEKVRVPAEAGGLMMEIALRLDSAIQTGTSSQRMRRAGLEYCKLAGWPPECEDQFGWVRQFPAENPYFALYYLDFLHQNGRNAGILEFLDGYADLDRLPRWIRRHRVEALLGLERREQCLQELSRFLGMASHPDDFFFGAKAYNELNRPWEALHYFDLIADERHNDWEFVLPYYQLLIDTLRTRGKQVLGSFCEDYPGNTRANSLLLEAHLEDNELSDALRLFSDNPSMENHRLLAEHYAAMRRWGSALWYYQQILLSHPDQKAALKGVAAIYRQRGYDFKALETFNRILSRDSTDREAAEGRTEMEARISRHRGGPAKGKIPLLKIPKKDYLKSPGGSK